MGSIISVLWGNECLPIKDGVYFSDGRSYAIKIEQFPIPMIEVGGEFDFTDFYSQNEEEVTSVDRLKALSLSDGGTCCVGDGSFGSEGFIARLAKDESLMWVVYSENSNPFFDVEETDDGCVIAKSSAKYSLKINVDDPLKIALCNNAAT